MINYAILAESREYYSTKGYNSIEVPWTVSKAVSDITRPRGNAPYQLAHNSKCLVGSGEQSFLYLLIKGFIVSPGKYQAITPCFRDEFFDSMHSKYFMKNELFVAGGGKVHVNIMVDDALKFFRRYLPDAEAIQIEGSDLSYDIEWRGHELGSYGLRSHKYLVWSYGTGVAEPRLSNLIKLAEDGRIPL